VTGEELVPSFPIQTSLRVDPTATSLDLPVEPNTWRTDLAGRDILWLGPDEWLVVERRTDDLVVALAGMHHSLVDVSANRAVLDLSSPDRLELLSAGCGLDLEPRSWRSGMCAQTLLAKVPVLLQERERSTRVFLRPSFVAWLRAWLEAISP
jgi:sarcosine oxidase, subunit gamma